MRTEPIETDSRDPVGRENVWLDDGPYPAYQRLFNKQTGHTYFCEAYQRPVHGVLGEDVAVRMPTG